MNRLLHSPMSQQGQIQADELLVKPIALWRCWIHAHSGREPLYGPRTLAHAPLELIDGVGTIGMNRTDPLQTIRKTLGQCRCVTVRDVKCAQILPPLALLVVMKIEGEQHHFGPRRKDIEALEQTGYEVLVYPSVPFCAGGIQIKPSLQVLHRMKNATHLWCDPHSGVAIAHSSNVHMAVPKFRRIDSLP